MFQHLLVPLDGSPLAEAVLPPAAFIAHKTQGRVTLLHVVERHAPGTIHGQRHLRTAEEAERYLREVASWDVWKGVEVHWHVHDQEGKNVAASLHEHAGKFLVDLVILSDHGKRHLRDHFSGNVAQQLARKKTPPVLLLRGGDKVKFPFSRILAPFRTGHGQGLPYAAQFARLCSCPLELAMVVATTLPSGPTVVTRELLPATTREVLELAQRQAVEVLTGQVAALLQQGVCAEGKVLCGNPVDLIPRRADDIHADLVVLSTHGKAGMKAFWQGSLTSKWVSKLTASLLLAPASDETAE